MSNRKFPNDFLWGAATASIQIEGGANQDGRGKSVWDTFCEKPGYIIDSSNINIACDHYNRWEQDIDLMKDINIGSYRLSIAWPRILPNGEGKINTKGIDFYNRLFDKLLENGITPYVTAFHWDLPQALQDKYGGWASKEVSKIFGDYVEILGNNFGDRVKNWCTVNEIICYTALAHKDGKHAPGGVSKSKLTAQTTHNALLGHGYAVQALRKTVKDAFVGIVDNPTSPWPIYETEENIEAARKAFIDMNPHVLEPILTGTYNKTTFPYYSGVDGKGDLPDYTEDEMKIIQEPIDFLGLNYYQGPAIRAANNERGWEVITPPKKYPRNNLKWPITPKGLYWLLNFSYEAFGKKIPLIVTENGIATDDIVEKSGEIHDLDRLEYYRNHLEQCHRAIKNGVDLKGYFAWSLMDNFEWSEGYSQRFGLYRVNYATQERTLKLSGKYYSEVVKNNSLL